MRCGKNGLAYKSVNVCMFLFKYRHLSRIQTKVEEEFKSCMELRDRERHLLVHLLPIPSTSPATVINVMFSLFTADSQEHN